MQAVGYGGYNWTSFISSGNIGAHRMTFYADGIFPSSDLHRAYGLPLRCLQE
ncbi:MAG: hypothetical protein K2K83_03355 [Rikenella sp.]|nr:hypothetical protein [Rikenella sp.]